MTDRYETIYDENDYILDNKTGEYLTIEEACNQLNTYHEDLDTLVGFLGDVKQKITDANEEG